MNKTLHTLNETKTDKQWIEMAIKNRHDVKLYNKDSIFVLKGSPIEQPRPYNRIQDIVENTDSIYFTDCTTFNSKITDNKELVEAFVSSIRKKTTSDNYPVYFFSESKLCWYQLVGDNWEKIKLPPSPSGNYIGVGARSMSLFAKMEINYL